MMPGLKRLNGLDGIQADKLFVCLFFMYGQELAGSLLCYINIGRKR